MIAMSRYVEAMFFLISSWKERCVGFIMMRSGFSFYSLGKENLATDFTDEHRFFLS